MNTLMYAKKLEAVGFSREQAEVSVSIINEVIETNLATKDDLKNLTYELRQEMKDLRHEMHMLRSELIIKLGAMVITAFTLQTAACAALVKFYFS